MYGDQRFRVISAFFLLLKQSGLDHCITIPSDDGSVICSDFSNNQWKFTTLRTPWDYDHPVSVNRGFGYIQNPDGTFTFYTRGIDHFTQLLFGQAAAWIVTGGDAFKGADKLWESFQEGVADFVNRLGGQAVVNEPIKWSKVKDVIEGRRPITDLCCE